MRRGLGLVLLSLALMTPGVAGAKARAVEDYKVLVVTSAADAGVRGGRVGDPGGRDERRVHRHRSVPATVGEQFTPANLEQYRAVVFLATGLASPLNEAQRDRVRGLLPRRRRLRRRRLGDRDRPVVARS